MNWIAASLISAFFLGAYDLATKQAVNRNAVLPVLFLSNACSAAIWAVLMACCALRPALMPHALHVAPLTLEGHARIFLKSAVVAASWSCSYFGVKHLPVSITAPIRGTGPMWTLLGALLVLGERPTPLQGVGVVITIISFISLSYAGRAEGIFFLRNPWIAWLGAGLVFNSVSALYDRYLFGTLHLAPSTVQAWFSIYLAVLFLPLAAGWKLRLWKRQEFTWRWSIPLVSVFLLAADFVYFRALGFPDGLVSIVSILRRSSTVVTFLGGVILLRERGGLRKLPALAGVMAGVGLTLLGNRQAGPHPVLPPGPPGPSGASGR